jgi:hypothetical protein
MSTTNELLKKNSITLLTSKPDHNVISSQYSDQA